MWTAIRDSLKHSPARLRVVRAIIELGLSVREDGKIYCGYIEIPPTKIARAIGIDRRVIIETVRMILSKPELKEIFENIKPAGPFFRDVAKKLGFGVVVIDAEPKAVGVVAESTALIADEGISIRQILAEDPELFPEPKLTIITERQLPGGIIPKLLKIAGVRGVSVF
ncbi:MAG: amino acid-binding protein [Promethearchaeota archaeon]